MTYENAIKAAHLVAHIPEAARAILDHWLDVNQEGHDPLPALALAGYTCRDPDAYMLAFEVNIQHPSEIAQAHGLPWALPAGEPDLVGALRAHPKVALEAVAQAKIARKWKATKDGPTRHDLRGFKLVRVRCEHDKAAVEVTPTRLQEALADIDHALDRFRTAGIHMDEIRKVSGAASAAKLQRQVEMAKERDALKEVLRALDLPDTQAVRTILGEFLGVAFPRLQP